MDGDWELGYDGGGMVQVLGEKEQHDEVKAEVVLVSHPVE